MLSHPQCSMHHFPKKVAHAAASRWSCVQAGCQLPGGISGYRLCSGSGVFEGLVSSLVWLCVAVYVVEMFGLHQSIKEACVVVFVCVFRFISHTMHWGDVYKGSSASWRRRNTIGFHFAV